MACRSGSMSFSDFDRLSLQLTPTMENPPLGYALPHFLVVSSESQRGTSKTRMVPQSSTIRQVFSNRLINLAAVLYSRMKSLDAES